MVTGLKGGMRHFSAPTDLSRQTVSALLNCRLATYFEHFSAKSLRVGSKCAKLGVRGVGGARGAGGGARCFIDVCPRSR